MGGHTMGLERRERVLSLWGIKDVGIPMNSLPGKLSFIFDPVLLV